MKTKTHLKAGGFNLANHNETLVRATRPATGLKVKTHVKAGGGNRSRLVHRQVNFAGYHLFPLPLGRGSQGRHRKN
jgi:hypothetical protein